MLYTIAHFLRDKCPFIWDLVDGLNALLFSLRYGRKLDVVSSCLKTIRKSKRDVVVVIEPMNKVPTDEMVSFFARQPEDSFTFFRPHLFDYKTIKKLQHNRSFIAYVFRDRETRGIVGYFFLRSFFMGKAYRGRMVDYSYQSKGLGTLGNQLMNEIGFGIGLRIFESVSKKNIASYKSSISAGDVVVVEELEHDEVLLEALK